MITGDKKEPRTKGWLPSRSVTPTGGSQRETGDSPGRFTFAAPPAGVHSDDLCECVDDLPLALWALGRSSDGRGGWCYRHRQSSVPKASYPKSKPTSFLPFREGRSVPGKSVSLGEAHARSLARRSPEKVAGRNLRTSQNTPVPTVSQASVLSASASEMRLARAMPLFRSPAATLCTEPLPRLRRTFQLYPVGLNTKSPCGGLAVRVCRRNIALRRPGGRYSALHCIRIVGRKGSRQRGLPSRVVDAFAHSRRWFIPHEQEGQWGEHAKAGDHKTLRP